MALRFSGAVIAIAAASTLFGALLIRASGHAREAQPQPTQQARAPAPHPARTGAPALAAVLAATPLPAATTARDATGELVLRAAWGDRPGELGHRRPSEGAPQGPMSFTVDAAGRVHVLDQVNSRIEVFDGAKVASVVPVPRVTFQDIALDGNGGWILLDRLGTPALVFLSPDGTSREVKLVGRGVSEGGAVTALFARADGIWVEVEHAELVRVADTTGGADPTRPRAQGRFSAGGASIQRALLAGRESVTVLSQEAGIQTLAPSRATRLSFPDPVLHIETLEVDSNGHTFLVADLVHGRVGNPAVRSAPPSEIPVAVVLDPLGAEIDRFRLQPRGGPEEQFRAVRLGDDEALYQLVCDDTGASVRRYAR